MRIEIFRISGRAVAQELHRDLVGGLRRILPPAAAWSFPLNWLDFLAQLELEVPFEVLGILAVPDAEQIAPGIDQAEQPVLELLAQRVGDIVLRIFGPGEPHLADLEAGEVRGPQAIDMVLVLVRDDRDIDEPARGGDDVLADLRHLGRRRELARRAGLEAAIDQHIGRLVGVFARECDQETVAVADAVHADRCAAGGGMSGHRSKRGSGIGRAPLRLRLHRGLASLRTSCGASSRLFFAALLCDFFFAEVFFAEVFFDAFFAMAQPPCE